MWRDLFANLWLWFRDDSRRHLGPRDSFLQIAINGTWSYLHSVLLSGILLTRSATLGGSQSRRSWETITPIVSCATIAMRSRNDSKSPHDLVQSSHGRAYTTMFLHYLFSRYSRWQTPSSGTIGAVCIRIWSSATKSQCGDLVSLQLGTNVL